MATDKVWLFSGIVFVIVAVAKLVGDNGAVNNAFLVIGLSSIVVGLSMRERKGGNDAR